MCEDFPPFGKQVKNILRNDLGFQVYDAVGSPMYCWDHRHPKPIYHVPDFLLEVHLLKYILENRRTRFRNIMVISSDYDFSYTTNHLMNRDYRVFLARLDTSDPELDDDVDYAWNWQSLEDGRGGLLPFDPPNALYYFLFYVFNANTVVSFFFCSVCSVSIHLIRIKLL